ncbi:hypothetical protein SODALDRAFT_349753 [Sodiomyces alkalinus F11]|uniref:Uncharacterized protein n=1 Tax=Sodiomyces alkalinus (strain CBS 110278 / VKM F-3762 / F11) TaxID=1314773 RepID=A0A3N2PYI7_SODAK|nr:hypothetical protein SODALDRAFT_349753 [Sodiomyces alkalinus F11]ROT39554.1 hypothetical protein SODALDRAFT_349753 [Sodiomyces alkalinus F11]
MMFAGFVTSGTSEEIFGSSAAHLPRKSYEPTTRPSSFVPYARVLDDNLRLGRRATCHATIRVACAAVMSDKHVVPNRSLLFERGSQSSMAPSRTDALTSPTHDESRPESSAAANTPNPATTTAPLKGKAQNVTPPTQRRKDKEKEKEKDEVSGQRGHRIRSSGGFLLQNAFHDASGNANRAQRRGQPRYMQQSQKANTNLTPRTSTSERSASSAGAGAGASFDPQLVSPSTSNNSPRPRSGGLSSPLTEDMEDVVGRRRETPNGALADHGYHASSHRTASQPLDIDSALIVNMALNLSESRRVASRRTASAAVPPVLAPLPDAGTGTGGSLKQHLQQQRRTSRNISPRPDHGLSPRLPSGATRANSPLQPSFDLTREASYRHHFTPATLARAQKAKDQLELMAQYRRLLELVPPLDPLSRRPSTANPTTSLSATSSHTSTSSSPQAIRPLGRPYNPLQYIRNRKVRARERKAIDGETLGFGDVKKVTDWIDNVARWAATGQSALPDNPALPPFADAEAHQAQLESPVSNAPRPRRPRVDWVINPVDMIADVYWLEQDHHLQLIEDRHWRRIFPLNFQDAVWSFRPVSSPEAAAKARPDTSQNASTPQLRTAVEPPGDEATLAKTDTGHSRGSTRERARQKLQELKGLPHHRGSSLHGPIGPPDMLPVSKTSTSELADDESERSKEGRDQNQNQPQVPSASDRNEILQKQMLEMIARERVNETPPAPWLHRPSMVPMTPERAGRTTSQPSSQSQSRKQSLVDASEPDDASGVTKTRPTMYGRHRGRSSLEIPMPVYRGFMDADTSVPNSPDNRPPRDSPFIPPIGGDLSPASSRAGSPHRNPFHKVRNIFRERSRDRERERERDIEPQPHAKYTELELPVHPKSAPPGLAQSPLPRAPSPDRQAAGTVVAPLISQPQPQPQPRPSTEGLRAGAKIRTENSTPNNLSRGARLDTVIRGGVSKLGDLIWRKDSEPAERHSYERDFSVPDEPGVDTTTIATKNNNNKNKNIDDNNSSLALPRTVSDTTADREDDRNPRAKHYLDVMPTFQHTPHEPNQMGREGLQTSRPPSRSSRFDLLKPPRIDVQHPSPSLSPTLSKSHGESESRAEQAEAGTGSDGLQEASRRLSSFAARSSSFSSDPRHPSLASSFEGRHLSISDRSATSQPAPVSKREVARLRALVLSSGIKAMEISRRANQPVSVFAARTCNSASDADKRLCWPSIAQLSADPSGLRARAVPQTELYHVAAQSLAATVQSADGEWQRAVDEFAGKTAPALQDRVEDIRRRIAVDLSAMTRAAADDADEASRDLAFGQRLKVTHVVDTMEKMIRRRRRRFRWVRRGLWLGVEWVLVGFMWYVWFVVVILRMFWGVGRAFVGGVRWLLWL